MIQQRRPFFQAAISGRVTTAAWQRPAHFRFRLFGRIAAILTALLFFGCASLTPERVQIIAAIAGQAAQFGAQQWLAKHPDQRQLFDEVIGSILILVRAGITNQNAYIEQLSRLPTSTLVGPDGAVIVTMTNLVVRDEALQKDVVVTDKATMSVVKATALGLRKGTAPMPPVPVIVVSPARRVPPRGTPVPTFRPGAGPSTNAAPLSDAELDRQYQETLKQLKKKR